MISPADVVQAQLDAYNAQDIDAFSSCFADDCVLADLNGVVIAEGKAAIRARYAKLFADYPQNRAHLINRIAVGDVVIDHEDIRRSPSERVELAMIYTVRAGAIIRAEAVRRH